MRKKTFYDLFIITLAMQDFRLQCTYIIVNLLDRCKIPFDLDVLFKDGSLEVLFYGCGININDVSNFPMLLKYTMFFEY